MGVLWEEGKGFLNCQVFQIKVRATEFLVFPLRQPREFGRLQRYFEILKT